MASRAEIPPLIDSARSRSSCCLSVAGSAEELVSWDSDANDIPRCSRRLATSRLGGSCGHTRSGVGSLIPGDAFSIGALAWTLSAAYSPRIFLLLNSLLLKFVILGKGKGSICGWLLVGGPSLRRLFFQTKQYEMKEMLKRKSAAIMMPMRAEDGRCFPAARCREVVEAEEGVDGADNDFGGLTDRMLV
jgi:hypothetical protein